jgi:crotonobetainyl-CoA:carnitine CoA-transferase CaiB-like acyl-CoA transferase
VSIDAGLPVFDGLRVVELSQGMAGPLVGQLLSDNGADVVKIEPPGGDWARSMPGFVVWNRGKQSVTLDLADPVAREAALALIDDADVLVESVRGGTARALGLTTLELRARNARLVHCTITGFGPAERWERLPAYEGIVAARIGRFLGADIVSGLSEVNRGERPVFNITPFGSYASACLATVGIVGALRSRTATGVGTRVDTSLLEGVTGATMRVPFRREGEYVKPLTEESKARDLVFRGIKLAFMTAECADGRYIQMCARQPDHYQRWLQAIGLSHLLDDPRFANGPVGFGSFEDVDEIDELIRKAMSARTQSEWMALFAGEFDVGADPFLTSAEFLEMPDMVGNGRVVEIVDPVVGPTTQIGPLALLGTSRSTIGRPAPRLGEHQARVRASASRPSPSAMPVSAPALARPPLEGITILEAAYFIAGTLASTILAELGARVIKLEPMAGDPFRRTNVEFAQVSHGKESIAINLKCPEARAVVDQLLRSSDVFVHSFRPGVPERLGIGYERVHELNKELLYVYAASYGSKGPQASRPAFHSTPNALVGAGIVQAGSGNPPVDDSYPDPCAGLGVAAAIAIGLHARDRLGVGQYLETTMLTSTGTVHSDMVVQYPGRPEAQVPDHGQHGLHALYRLYQCADGWIFVAAVQEKEWRALATAVARPEWLSDQRFATHESRFRDDALLADALSEIFRSRTAAEWQEHLLGCGVPATRADEQTFEEFLVANVEHRPMTHPDFGDYWRRPPAIRVEGCEPVNVSGAPRLGEHTAALLTELGYSADECRALVDAGVVGVL